MYRTYIWLTVMWPPGPRSPSSTLRLFGLLAADEEAALRLQHQWRVGRPHVLDRLRQGAGRYAEAARSRQTGRNGRSAQHRETLSSHGRSPLLSNSVVAPAIVKFDRTTGVTARSGRRDISALATTSPDDQRTVRCQAFLAYSSTNRNSITHASRMFRQTSRPRCLYHCCDDDHLPAKPVHTRDVFGTRRACSPAAAAVPDPRGRSQLPLRTLRSQRPAHWRSDDSPIGSRRTLPTTGRFSSGSRAPMPYAFRG